MKFLIPHYSPLGQLLCLMQSVLRRCLELGELTVSDKNTAWDSCWKT